MRLFPVLFLLACGGHVPPTPAPAAAPARQTAGLQTELAVESAGLLAFTVHNPTDADRTFCTYHTPFEGLRNDILVVRRSGRRVPYAGIMAKRAPPGPDDFRTLAAGESASVSFALTDGYALEPGTYNVLFAGNDVSGLPPSSSVILTLP